MRSLKLWQSSVAVLIAILYWALLVATPDTLGPWPGWVRVTVGLTAGVMVVAGAVTFVIGLRMTDSDEGRGEERRGEERRGEVVFIGFGLILLGLVALVATAHFGQQVTVSADVKFAAGVGGVALGGFVFAATQFDTIRAAASVPVVLLLIGVATWPGAEGLMDPSLREALITWMGVILSINGVAEAAKQVGVARARSTTASPGDLAPLDRTVDG